MAVPHEVIAVDTQREMIRQARRSGNVQSRAAGRDVPHRAVDRVTVPECQSSALEYAVSGVCTSFDDVFVHGRYSH